MGSRFLWSARLLLALGSGLLAMGCAGMSGEAREAAADTYSDFTIGEVYEVTEPLKAARWGDRITLVPAVKVEAGGKQPFEVINVPAGTTIRVVSIRETNTLTHGMETWPEAVCQSGPLAGQALSLAHPDIALYLRRRAE